MKNGNVIKLNLLHLNSCHFNGSEKVQKGSAGGGSIVIPPPPVEPEPTPTYTLSASVTNGKVSAKRNGSAVNLPFTANEGDTIIVEVTPNDGYSFEGWADGNTDNPRTITMTADVVLSAQCVEVVQPPVESKYIQFEDKKVEAICVANWSSDGIGLTMEDAAAVTDIGLVFNKNTEIKRFNEFRYFVAVRSLRGNDSASNIAANGAFYGCSALQSIQFPPSLETINGGAFANTTALAINVDIPSLKDIRNNAFRKSGIISITNLGTISELGSFGTINYGGEGVFYGCANLTIAEIPSSVINIPAATFYNCSALTKIICRATIPPTLGNYAFNGSTCPIYVPDASLEAYKTAVNWSAYADRIHPLSEIEDYYISDALLMHLDGINKGNVEGEWQDLVGNNHFQAKADTPMPISLDNGWEFNGVDTMMICDNANKVSWSPTSADGTRTMEIVVEFTGTEDKSCCFTMGSAGFAFGRTNSKYILGATGAKAAMVNENGLAPRKCVFTYIGNGVAYENGVLLSSASSDYWNANWTLGAASNGRYFKGKIHAIRIHDRILSQDEILYNQRIDNKRFNLGLDI